MSGNLIITVVSVAEGLAASGINSYRTHDTDQLLVGQQRTFAITQDFGTFQYGEQIEFDYQDTVFEQFSVDDDQIIENETFDNDSGAGRGNGELENDEATARIYVRQQSFAWREVRPSVTHWVAESTKTSVHITLISALISILGCALVFLDMNSADVCSWLDIYDIPKPIQQIKVLCQSTFAHLSQYFFVTSMIFAFGFKLIHHVNLIYWNIVIAFSDTLYRVGLYMFSLYGESWKSYPLNALFLFSMLLNCYVLARYFFTTHIKRLTFVLQLGAQIAAPSVIVMITFYKLLPWSLTLDSQHRLIVAVLSPLLGTIAKVVSRLCIQSMRTPVTHPGNLYIISIGSYVWASIVYRTFQVDLKDPLTFSMLCLLHGVSGVIEKSSVLLRDHCVAWLYSNCLGREATQNHRGIYRTPRMKRYVADLMICSMVHEHISFMYCITILWAYPLTWTRNQGMIHKNLTEIAFRSFVALASEFIFNAMSIFILTWYQNIPIVKLWLSKWKKYVKVNTFVCIIVIGYVTHYLVNIADSRYLSTTLYHNGTQRACNDSLFL